MCPPDGASPTGSARGSLISRPLSIYNVNLASPDGIAAGSQDDSCCIRVAETLHGYLRHVCNEADIEYIQDDKIIDLFKKLLAEHEALQDLGPRPQDTSTITKAFCGVMTVIDPLRNRASFAHPTPALLGVPEAVLAINAAKTILHYVDAKLAAVAVR